MDIPPHDPGRRVEITPELEAQCLAVREALDQNMAVWAARRPIVLRIEGPLDESVRLAIAKGSSKRGRNIPFSAICTCGICKRCRDREALRRMRARRRQVTA